MFVFELLTHAQDATHVEATDDPERQQRPKTKDFVLEMKKKIFLWSRLHSIGLAKISSVVKFENLKSRLIGRRAHASKDTRMSGRGSSGTRPQEPQESMLIQAAEAPRYGGRRSLSLENEILPLPGSLIVRVMKASGLRVAADGNKVIFDDLSAFFQKKSDPWCVWQPNPSVSIFLNANNANSEPQPGRTFFETKVWNKSTDPAFNEEFTFSIPDALQVIYVKCVGILHAHKLVLLFLLILIISAPFHS
jgi:hypothetical protein